MNLFITLEPDVDYPTVGSCRFDHVTSYTTEASLRLLAVD